MTEPVPEDKLRLGGMALRNGLLVHGPDALGRRGARRRAARSRWRRAASPTSAAAPPSACRACAACQAGRGDGGDPARQARAARRRGCRCRTRARSGAMGAAALGRPGDPARPARARVGREAAVALVSLAPALLALRSGDLAAYHGVEHKAIAAYEDGRRRRRRRQGARPLRLAPGGADAGRRGGRATWPRAGPGCAARRPRRRSAWAAPRWRWRCSPGPSATRTARVTRAAAPARPRDPARGGHARAHGRAARGRAGRRWRRSCGSRPRAEHGHRGRPRASGSTRSVFRLPVERIRDGLLHGRLLQLHARSCCEEHGRHPRVTMQVFQKQRLGARRHRRGDRGAQAVLGPQPEAGAGWDELEVHALHEGDEIAPLRDRDDDRGRLLAVRPPRDRLPRLPGPPHA